MGSTGGTPPPPPDEAASPGLGIAPVRLSFGGCDGRSDGFWGEAEADAAAPAAAAPKAAKAARLPSPHVVDGIVRAAAAAGALGRTQKELLLDYNKRHAAETDDVAAAVARAVGC
ncbi:hypothetical protein DIPPA_08720 [Diplonema papillatum]|nr:hypothetical protein DIPPA_08720 [Diplonema papillatum]